MKRNTNEVNIFWFRRDLRLDDNKGLFQAINAGLPVQCIFIFDQNILEKLSDQNDARVSFIHAELLKIQTQLERIECSLDVRFGQPEKIWSQLLADYNVNTVYANQDYEPYAITRDQAVEKFLLENQIAFKMYTDHLIFHPSSVLKGDGTPYLVFTPYSRKWKASLADQRTVLNSNLSESNKFESFKSEKKLAGLLKSPPNRIQTLEEIGFVKTSILLPSDEMNHSVIESYDQERNYPAREGTSRLGVHLRFGTISIRKLARIAAQLNETFLNELIWREFYASIMFHFPHVVERSFRKKYDRIVWRNDETEFDAWCTGNTGYPLVDAGMRQLNATGFMHNRVRMVVASFLTKHLLIDWRWGEAYFARYLLDFELASNNGGWQWAAGCGTDAAPYFRIFNPESQMKKFDQQKIYIEKWVPEMNSSKYPEPIVDHKVARERCLLTYKTALNP